MKTVYLAGPITGLTYGGATEWREYAAEYLKVYGIKPLSPMRWKEGLKGVVFTNQGYDSNPMTTQKGIVSRDRNDVRTADLVLMNLVGANKASVGSAVELGWADAWRIPVVTVLDVNDTSNPMTHAFVKELSSFVVPTLEEALQVALSVLCVKETPGGPSTRILELIQGHQT